MAALIFDGSVDITKKDEVKRLADEIASKESNGIHLLVNNGACAWSVFMDDAEYGTAGVARDDNTKYSNSKPDFSSAQSISEHLWKSEPENWQETFQTNLTAQFFVTAAFLPLLAKGGDATPGYTSSVVNIASISGVMKGSSNGQFAYATSKAGMCAQPASIVLSKAEPTG